MMPIPQCIKEAFIDWALNAHPKGGFVTAVLENDLVRAFTKADSLNRTMMLEIVTWMVSNMPSASYGSVKNVKEWKGIPNSEYAKQWKEKF